MSSRNAYLDAGQRRVAAMLFRVLSSLAARLTAPGADIARDVRAARRRLIEAGFAEVEYLALCDAETLAPLDAVDRPARLLAAVTIGAVRLIDNLAVGGEPS